SYIRYYSLYSLSAPPSFAVFYFLFFSISRRPPTSTLFPYTTLFRSAPCSRGSPSTRCGWSTPSLRRAARCGPRRGPSAPSLGWRSEEHTSELQSRFDLVCRLLLEKKKTI